MVRESIQEAINRFLDSYCDGQVLVVSEYSPNGNNKQWTAYRVQEDHAIADYDWDSAFYLSTGELKLTYRPSGVNHMYMEYYWENAEDYTNGIVHLFCGNDGFTKVTELSGFSGWLVKSLGLRERSKGHDACMVEALEAAKKIYQRR